MWRAAQQASVGQIATAAATTWREIDTALSPIIGQRGVNALFKRSIHLTKVIHPSLATVRETLILPGEFTLLHAMLVEESNTQAVLINSALLNTFHELICNLIGESLTRQLLHSVVDTPSSGNSAQDNLS
ncbi:MAG: hypothetical protein EOO68_24565 [Moraxellaceae bacterium]|nr:MAG: hypothetical protein EOO68_24565 [Moraxellaceae bacterium]